MSVTQKVKHVVSVGLGSSLRDVYIKTDLLGQAIILERRGTDGDVKKAKALLENLRDKVDAFGLGGTDLFIQVAGKRYYLRESLALAKHAGSTPIVCGAGLKDSLERYVVKQLDTALNWKDKKVLLVSAADRFGMAEAISDFGADILYGDALFLLGLNMPLKNLKALARVARFVAPLAVQLPISWLYPTGKHQESTKTKDWRAKYFSWADIIAGDFHLIRRYAPEDLKGKIILTNTTTQEDVSLMQSRGVSELITTTPRFQGRSLSTNLLEAAFVALSGKYPLEQQDYEQLIAEAKLEPNHIHF